MGDGGKFEKWCARLIGDLYHVRVYNSSEQIEGRSGARHQVDLMWRHGIIRRPVYCAECKWKESYKSSVTKSEVSAFLGVLGDIDVPPKRAHYLTTGVFSPSARKLGEHNSMRMWDYQELQEKDWKRLGLLTKLWYNMLGRERPSVRSQVQKIKG